MKNLANWIAGKNYYVKNSTKLPFYLLSQIIILSVASRFSHNLEYLLHIGFLYFHLLFCVMKGQWRLFWTQMQHKMKKRTVNFEHVS
jgi:hypothetical protein